MDKIKVGIIGAGGYGGCGAIELLLGHPNAEIIERLSDVDVMRTDEDGTIELITDGQTLWIK